MYSQKNGGYDFFAAATRREKKRQGHKMKTGRKKRVKKNAGARPAKVTAAAAETTSAGTAAKGTVADGTGFFREACRRIRTYAFTDPRAMATGIFIRALVLAISFFVGKTPLLLDTYPLGIALLTAVSKKKFYIYVLVGTVLSAFAVPKEIGSEVLFSPYVYLAAYLTITAVRTLARVFIDPPDGMRASTLVGAEKGKAWKMLYGGLFGENVFLRMASACAAAFLVGLYSMSAGGYRFYDLFSAMFGMVSAPVFAFVFSCCGSETETRVGKAMSGIFTVGFSFVTVLSLKNTEFFGADAAVFLACAAVLYLGRRKNAVTAAAAGLAAGLAVNSAWSPAFVLAAIASFVMRGRSEYASACLAFTVSALWCAYVGGLSALSLFVPPFLCASVLVIALGAVADKGISDVRSLCLSADKAELGTAYEERITKLGETFGALADSLYRISERMKSPSGVEINAICKHSLESRCRGCVRNGECYSERFGDRLELISKLGELLARNGRVEAEELPKHAGADCLYLPDVIVEVNTEFAELVRDGIKGEKTELFALDYDAVSHILKETVEENRRDSEIDTELTEKVRRGIYAETGICDIKVFGTGDGMKKIYSACIGKKAEKIGSADLKAVLEKACGFPLRDLVFELKNGKVAMSTEAAKRFDFEDGAYSLSPREDEVCGDCVKQFDTPSGKFYSLISDGMGTGERAAFASEICGMFLSKMLEGGNRKDTSLKMLNTLLRARGDETSATVDLAELDPVRGKASFVKSGAVSSFIKRRDKLYKLSSSTAPIGIMKIIDAEQVCFDIEDGDVIIMMSDGVSQSPEECVPVMELLGEDMTHADLGEFAKRIVTTAAKNGSRDDISAALVRVSARKAS